MRQNDFLKQNLFLDKMNDEEFQQAMEFLSHYKCRVKNISLHLDASSNSQISNFKNFIAQNNSVTKIDLNFYNKKNSPFLKKISHGMLMTIPLYLCTKIMERMNENKSISYFFAYATVMTSMLAMSITGLIGLYEDINHQNNLENELFALIDKKNSISSYNGTKRVSWQAREAERSNEINNFLG